MPSDRYNQDVVTPRIVIAKVDCILRFLRCSRSSVCQSSINSSLIPYQSVPPSTICTAPVQIQLISVLCGTDTAPRHSDVQKLCFAPKDYRSECCLLFPLLILSSQRNIQATTVPNIWRWGVIGEKSSGFGDNACNR